jgi:peptide/nickel transport system permease protein
VRRRFAARLGQSIVVTFIVATIAFFAIRSASGDPFSYTAKPMSERIRNQLRHDYGYDRPVPEQYVRYLRNVARGELGWSFNKGEWVTTVLAQALPRTLLLAGTALVLSFVIGVALGVMQAARPGWFDRATSTVILVFYSVPDFWGALVMLTIFASWWRLFPAGDVVTPFLHDYMPPWTAFVDRVRHLILPVASLTLLSLASITRYQRAAMLDVLPSEFIRTARAKGVSERGLVWRHAFRNALTPMVTILGLTLPAFLGGVVFIERVFTWPGLGTLATEAIEGRDYDLVTGTVVVGALLVVLGNLLADLLHAALDPRIRE